jgi:hypothetical protein
MGAYDDKCFDKDVGAKTNGDLILASIFKTRNYAV